jgi:hypothetical protein
MVPSYRRAKSSAASPPAILPNTSARRTETAFGAGWRLQFGDGRGLCDMSGEFTGGEQACNRCAFAQHAGARFGCM